MSLSRSYQQKKNNLLKLAIFSSLSILIISALLIIFIKDTAILTLILMFLLVGLLILLLRIKPHLMYYSMNYTYHTLLENSVERYEVKEKFDKKWINNLLANKYILYKDDDNFMIFYQIKKNIERSKFNNDGLLEIITVFKNNLEDFYSEEINEHYKTIWVSNQASHKISKQVIIQLKKYDTFSLDTKIDLDRIISFKENRNYLITINVGYFMDDASLYFLHSKDFYPNLYYKHGVELIQFLIK